MMFSEIIVATDLSAQAGIAARWGAAMAEQTGAAVAAAQVVELSVPNWMRGRYEVDENRDVHDKVAERITRWFEQNTRRAPDRVIIKVGDPTARLRALARELERPLLAVSRSGKGRLVKFLAGSTAQALAAEPPGPLVVVSNKRALVDRGMAITLATDLTDFSEPALEVASDLARDLGGPLIIAHALGVPQDTSDEDLPDGLTMEGLRQEAEEALEAYVAAHQERLEGLEVERVLLPGEPTEALREHVEARDVQLLVAGHVDRPGLVENVFNRVTLKFLAEVETTLMIVPG